MVNKVAIFVLLIACCASANAQEPSGKIIFYRESNFLDSDYKPQLFCDGFELARMRSHSYMEVPAQPGRHSCTAESDQGPETIIEIVPGGVAYLRIVITPTVKRHAVLTASNEEEYGKQKKLTRITTAELDSVQPLVPTIPSPPFVSINTNSREPSADGTKPEDVFHAGVNGVSTPRCVYCPTPLYTAKARKAKIEGTVQLKAIIGADGQAHGIEIVKALGQGMDERAIATVQTWRFEPAIGPNGEPVAVLVPIEIMFRLIK